MSDRIAPTVAGPWPDGIAATRLELTRYLDDIGSGALDALPTRCVPWTVRDITIHLTETFRRFGKMLDQGRRGDFTPPFAQDELDAENLRAVAAFRGHPSIELVAAVTGFLDAIVDLDEPVPHQFGTLPVGLQVLFGLMDIVMHHDDVLAADGRSYRPSSDALGALTVVGERLFGMPPDQDDPWLVMLTGAGRPPS